MGALLAFLIVVLLLSTLLDLLQGDWRSFWITLVFFPLTVPAWLLLRAGYPQTLAHLLLAGLWGANTSIALGGSGLYGNAGLYPLVYPALGGLLCGLSGTVVWSLVSAITLVSYAILHLQGALPTPEGLPLPLDRLKDALIVWGMLGGTTAMMQWLQRRAFLHAQESMAALRAENGERRRAEEAAQLAAQAQSRFLATMSHELRTPLNGVISAARLLDSTPPGTTREELQDTLLDSAEGLLAMINDVLDYSRLRADHLELEVIPVDLRRLLHIGLRPMRLLAQQKGLALELAISPGVPSWVLGDPTRLRQILLNLVGNAIKFTHEGSITVRLDPDGEHGERLCLVVQDTGIGIPEEAQSRLFQPFTQAEASTTRRYGGTGLGLAIVAQLAEHMGGSIGVRSAPGAGATFTVRLPCVPTAPQDVPEASPGAPVFTGLRVLVVDDNEVNRRLASLMLARWGHRPSTADGGQEALRALCDDPTIELVLMDCQMPDMDGLEATRRARRQLPAAQRLVPIVGFSADASAHGRDAALHAGMDDYLTKPLRPESLNAVLSRLITSRPPTGAPTSEEHLPEGGVTEPLP